MEKEIEHGNLRAGRVKSCGCYRRELSKAIKDANPAAFSGSRLVHGMTSSPTYSSWNMMLQRCTNPNRDNYEFYGGRGITVCERWRVFDNFLEDMGLRPEGTTLDRKNTNGHYEPSNCRWATPLEQSNNRRKRGPNKNTVKRLAA